MFIHKRMKRPELECLEARWVPATIKLVSGSLFISNQTAALTVTATATAGKFNVTDGAKTVTVSGVGSLISITGTNKADTINFKLAGNKFGGNLLLNTGNGDDRVFISGGGTGVIGGNLTALTGNGIDVVNVGQIKIGGNSTFNLGLGGDNNTFSGDQVGLTGLGTPVTYGGSVSIFNADNVFSDIPCNIGGNLSVGGNDGFANSWRLGVNVGGSASFTSGNTADLVRLNEDGSVAGNLYVNLGGGNDAYQQGSGIGGPLGKFDVFGNLAVNLGAGNDDFQIGNIGATIGGNATLDGGEGDNTYNLTAGMLVFGNLAVYGGNGVNDLATNAIQATVSGSLSFQFGNGNNLITLGATSSVAGKLNVLTGNGDNNLTLLGAQTYNANVRFGSGDDTVTLNNAGLILTGFLDGGTGNNKLDQMMGTLSPYLTLVNF